MRFRFLALACVLALSAYAAHAQVGKITPDAVNGGIFNSSAPSLSNGQPAPFQMDASGNLKVTSTGGGGGSTTITAPLGSATSPAAAVAVAVVSEVTQAVTNAGTFAVQNTAATPAGTNAIGSVTVSNLPATQPISGSVTVSTGTVTVNQGNAHAAGSAGWIFAANLVFNETTTNLAANAVFTGASQTTAVTDGTASPWTTFSAMVVTNQIGSITLQGSNDGTTWVNQATEATIAGTTAQLLATPVFFEFQRIVYTNGAVATTSLTIKTSYSFE